MTNSYRPHIVIEKMIQGLFHDGARFASRVPQATKYVGEEFFYGIITPFLYPTVYEKTKEWDNKESENYRTGMPFCVMGTVASIYTFGILSLIYEPRLLALPVVTSATDFLIRKYRSTKEKMKED